jgi:hypothetical protein
LVSRFYNYQARLNKDTLMKFSRAISRVRWFNFLETNVSKTISVLVLRVVELMWVRWTTQSFYLYLSKLRSQGRPFATGDLGAGSLPALPGSAFWYVDGLDVVSG